MNVFLKYVNIKTIFGDEYVGCLVFPDTKQWSSDDIQSLNFDSTNYIFYPTIPTYENKSVELRDAFPLSRVNFMVIPAETVIFAGRLTNKAIEHYEFTLKSILGSDWESTINSEVSSVLSALLSETGHSEDLDHTNHSNENQLVH